MRRRVAQHRRVADVLWRTLAASGRGALHAVGGEAALVTARYRKREVLHGQGQLQAK